MSHPTYRQPTMYQRIMVTGGAGFIGSHFVKYLLAHYPEMEVTNVDLLTYCGNLANVVEVTDNPRYHFYQADIRDYDTMRHLLIKHQIDCVINFAAESDNNQAISTPLSFASTNMMGTATLLEAVRAADIARVHHISTCEVFGPLSLSATESFHETAPYDPRTPYNASKAGGDLIAKSYYHTYGLPLTMSYCANNYGSLQFPEKVLPVFIIKALRNEPLPLFASAHFTREWIHVTDHCRALDLILREGRVGESYNIGTGTEKSIAELASVVLSSLQKPHTLIKTVPDRPAHDERYLLNSAKIRALGWQPTISWDEGVRQTISWYEQNEAWWQPLLEKSLAWQT